MSGPVGHAPEVDIFTRARISRTQRTKYLVPRALLSRHNRHNGRVPCSRQTQQTQSLVPRPFLGHHNRQNVQDHALF
jgi:hypothetical protein